MKCRCEIREKRNHKRISKRRNIQEVIVIQNNKIRGRIFEITICEKEKHPNYNRITDSLHGFCVNGVPGKVLNLRRGNTYIFKLNCQVNNYSFFLTSDVAGGPRGNCIPESYCPQPLLGTNILNNGNQMSVTIDNTFPSTFYYHCPEYQFMGATCQVHDQWNNSLVNNRNNSNSSS